MADLDEEAIALLLAGCTDPGTKDREDSAFAFETNFLAETQLAMSEAGGSLSLSNAVAIAHERTLKLTSMISSFGWNQTAPC